LAILLTVGCKSQQEPTRGAYRVPKPAVERDPATDRRRIVDAPDPRTIERPTTTVEPETRKEPAKRDLAAELLGVLGSPVDCLRDFEADSATTIRIPVSATVRPTGMVIQPAASATNISLAAQACIEKRVSLVKLEPLEKPLSQTVSTVIEIEYEPPVTVDVEGAPEPALEMAEKPLPKLPEVGPSGRAIQQPTSRPIDKAPPREPTGPSAQPVTGPKPRPIDGYEVDQNAQQWR
jgi:hypothetical protein